MIFVSIILAVIVSNIVGMFWYSPKMFGEKWKVLAKISSDSSEGKKACMMKMMVINSLLSLVTAYVLWVLVPVVGIVGIVLYWLAFSMPIFAGPVLWEGKSAKLFWINAGYSLVSVLAMSLIVLFVR